jgi:hypothetical protein
MGGAGDGDLLPPRLLRIHAQPPVHSGIRRRRGASFLQDAQSIELADRLDDPRRHQLEEHLIPAGRSIEP